MALPTASDNVFPKIILSEGAAPAAPAAGQVKMYAKADGLLYWKDDAGTEYPFGGSGMTNPMTTQGDTIYGGAAGTPTRLPKGTAAQVLTMNAGATAPEWAAGAGGSSWTQVINESGASFASWTSVSGTWASNGTVIQQTSTVADARRARYTAQVDSAICVMEGQIRFPSAGQAAVPNYGGFTIGSPSASPGNSIEIRLKRDATSQLQIERTGIINILSVNTTINVDTWYTLKVRKAGSHVAAYLDGTLIASAVANQTDLDTSYVSLTAFGALVDYRNIELWTPTLPT